MSMHKTPLTEMERAGLEAHGLPIGKPSKLSDCFRSGIAWAQQRIAQLEGDCAAHKAAEEMQIALREKMELQRDSLAAFAWEGITGLFESGLGWDADCIEEAALAYGLVFGEPYEPEGKHANNQCEIIEPGDTLLQMQTWVKEAGQRIEQNNKHPDQE